MLWMLEKRGKIKDFAVCMLHVIVLIVVQSVNTQYVWYGIRKNIYIILLAGTLFVVRTLFDTLKIVSTPSYLQTLENWTIACSL